MKTGTKRVHHARDKEGIIGALIDEKLGVFEEVWRQLLFAAQVRMQDSRREPLLVVDSGKGIDQSTFGNFPSWPGVSYLLALTEQDSSDALFGTTDAEGLRLTIFQDYANGGLATLLEYFRDRTVDLNGLLCFIDDRAKRKPQESNLDLSV